jgi:hypothetical protein
VVLASASTRAQPVRERPAPPRHVVKPAVLPRDVRPLPSGEDAGEAAPAGLSDAQLAQATEVGSGAGPGQGSGQGSGDGSGDGSGGTGGGGACDMGRRLQSALKRDPLVVAAVARARRDPATPARPILVWNGDWVRTSSEDGKGLAAVRESIMWEIAFAPEACRAQPVRGFVLLSLGEGAGAMRLAVGSERWRWTDLLRPHGTA